MGETSRTVGARGEQAVCDWLERQGARILCRNYTVRGGEIDIIAEEDGYLAFVEVKTRREGSMTSGAEAVTLTKQQRIVKAAAAYLYAVPSGLQPRFDIAEVWTRGGIPVRLRYLRSAFDTTGMNIIF